ncbi:MAG: zinc-ribbon domain-containing protein [Candidatus Thermoplasmatota archaeon]|nr:zinc-ribbon domain-containing protein [Candidatus Thermoplasmatota archaeon]MCL5789303.1 zinc-ribbon domain-containing protein [Candidatus Thermoplasmatota archaeon]
MYCRKCGAEIPDDSEFCPKCGAAQKAGQQAATGNAQEKTGNQEEVLKEMKCPNCGAPLNPAPGEAMVVCSYCGTSISLGSLGWSRVSKHFILDIKVQMKDQAEQISKSFLDDSIFHRHLFEKSELKKVELNYIPYWIMDAGYSAQYQYKREQVNPGGFVAVGMGGRGGFGGPTMNFQTVVESGSDVNEVKYPVIAIENMNQYQPPDYVFNLANKRAIGQSDMNGPVKLLNGTMGEEKARMEGKIRIQQWEIRKLQRSVHGFLSANVTVDIADMYLVHIPIWSLQFQHKNESIFLLIDAHNARVMEETKA